MENKTVQTIVPAMCPHCDKEILVSYQFTVPVALDVMKPGEIEKAKAELTKKIEDIEFKNEEEKAGILKWANDEGTLITLKDVDEIIKKIKEDQK